ncbi:disease susceptibility protein LOV1-like [Herrania umbratica]|uniref:Disease susceptibility protein LOV1-like n=1 Tax=Herrania umbratica TaxID=108875 RepID=A0A6J1AHQ8_9ROSI|nr:disease susceptibility protein LOV1-like [Herrania umbratica]
MAEAVVSNVAARLGDLVIQEAKLLRGVNDQVKRLQMELVWMKSFLKEADSRQAENEMVRMWVAEIREIAYDAEDVIETFALKIASKRRGGISNFVKRSACICKEGWMRHKVKSDIEGIISRISYLSQRLQVYGIKQLTDGASSSASPIMRGDTDDIENQIGVDRSSEDKARRVEAQKPQVFVFLSDSRSTAEGPENYVIEEKMEELGKDMVEQCAGLPLAIVVLGGVLVTKHSLNDWQIVHENLKSYIRKDRSQKKRKDRSWGVHEAIALSYDNLPPYLKPCFLYLSVFPEDYEIPVGKLVKLWVAEDIVPLEESEEDGEEMMEDVAEGYLNELVERYMVLVGERDASSKIKTCRMHDLIRDFCLLKAKQENFIYVLDRLQMEQADVSSLSPPIGKFRRLGINDWNLINRITNPHLRSALFFDENVWKEFEERSFLVKWLEKIDYSHSCSIAMGTLSAFLTLFVLCEFSHKTRALTRYICNNFKLLRILDFGDVDMSLILILLSDIGSLIHLRFLSFQSCAFVAMLPSFISKLSTKNCYLENIHCMKYLRELGIRTPFIVENFREDLNLNTPVITSKRLRSLSIRGSKFTEPRHVTYLLSSCLNIHELRLSVEIRKLPQHIPSNIAHICLCWTRLDEDPLPTLQKLPNLRILELEAYAFFFLCYFPGYVIEGEKEELGKDMVKQCAGLPLAIVVLGGILVTKHPIDDWRIMGENVKSRKDRSQKKGKDGSWEIHEAVALSYDNLPPYLKPCFLYLSVFPEDYEIPVSKLIKLWVAEDLVPLEESAEDGEEMIEDVAEGYLNELVERYMVLVGERDVSSKIKTCRMHDLIRDFCLLKAKQETFIYVLDRLQMEQADVSSLSPPIGKFRRLGINHLDLINRIKNPHLRSALFFDQNYRREFEERSSVVKWVEKIVGSTSSLVVMMTLTTFIMLFLVYEIRHETRKLTRYICKNFKLLRILDFRDADIQFLSILLSDIGSLIHLRFLSLGTSFLAMLPSFISKLRCLQTLDLSNCVGVYVPNVLWKLERLRHLYLPQVMVSTRTKLKLDALKNLQTLVNFNTKNCYLENIHCMKYLRELGIRTPFVVENFREDLSLNTPVITSKHLRSLSIVRNDDEHERIDPRHLTYLLSGCINIRELHLSAEIRKLPEPQHIPSNIAHICLGWARLNEDPLPTLQNLPNLRILELEEYAFVGEVIFRYPFLSLLSFEFIEVKLIDSINNV